MRLLERYLADADRQRRPEVNVLIHGPSGTGRTQLARLLAQALGLRLYEVLTEDRSSDSDWEVKDRLRAYRLAQRLLAHQPGTAILFDEVEDLFPASYHGMFKQDKLGKALVNDLLETALVPALWQSNNVWQLDPAAVRRFDYLRPQQAWRLFRAVLTEQGAGCRQRPSGCPVWGDSSA